MTTREVRRTAWIAVGAAGVPAAALGTLYIVGPLYLGAIGLIALVLARWRIADHLVAGLASAP